ncbi:MAG: extensin family protein [Bosea sp.]|uniref:extensin-like domain-containing protein n=1 Tax=Bosea sp. (in: a-proteobacteria) TaxID=1871050 RepID=UPI001AC3E5BC|nr:extensin family protein [Bosea sp. (in: a-proteobacteria)]MBN9453810.1 extensin family protein [Bosea sp. (in: a-proteobacteria)]
MRRAHLALIALGIVGATGLAGCGKFQKPQRAAWRDQAEAACMASRQVQISSYVSLRGKAIDGPGTCGMQQPLKVSAFSGGGIGLTSSATLSCPVVATTDKWLAEVVQPAAMNVLGAQVIELRAGSYSCRAMNNGTGTSRTSEHAFGNAVDVFSFRLNDNRVITVKDGWRGSPEEQNFLREVFVGACEHFSTVLGPGADPLHYDHFHIDLARHAKGRHICKPVIKYTPNYNLPPPDPTRPYSSAQTLPRGSAPSAGTVVAGGGLLRQPSDGLRPPGAVQGGYPVASYAQGQSGGLDAQQRFLEQYDARQQRGRYQPQPLPSESRGPLALPGAVEPSEEEATLGDGGGSGVMDQQGSEEALPINARNDPFAYSSGRVPPRR